MAKKRNKELIKLEEELQELKDKYLMYKLNLPTFDFKLSSKDSKNFIFDIIRKKHYVLTPEEWVRQNLIHYLVLNLNYPKSLIKVEAKLKFNNLTKRADILVYDNNFAIKLLVECKSYKIKLNKSAFDQASVYNKIFKSEYLMVSNGINHFCCQYDWKNKKIIYTDSFPKYKITK